MVNIASAKPSSGSYITNGFCLSARKITKKLQIEFPFKFGNNPQASLYPEIFKFLKRIFDDYTHKQRYELFLFSV